MTERSTPSEDWSPSFGALVKRHRLAAGLTQELLAERAGLSADAISLLERGLRTEPRKDTVARLADALELSVEARRTLHEAARRPGTPRQTSGEARKPRIGLTGLLRQRQSAAAASLFVVLVLLVGARAVGLLPDPLSKARPSTKQGPAASRVTSGSECAPDSTAAPVAGKADTAGAPPQVRDSFENPADPYWGAWWNQDQLTRSISAEQHHGGARALRLEITPGYVGVGTIDVTGLHPGSTVTIWIWYGGQGEGMVCPFLQTTRGQIEWLQTRELDLVAQESPQWHKYSWVMPNVPIEGVGVQLNDTSGSDLVVYLDDITW